MLTQKRLHTVLHNAPVSGIFAGHRGKRKGEVAHDKRGLLKIQIDNVRHLLHRLAWLWMTGVMSRWRIEHINGDHGDSRWSNLRQGDRLQNADHLAPVPLSTGIEGIWEVGNRFEVMIATETVTQNLSSFATLDEARDAFG